VQYKIGIPDIKGTEGYPPLKEIPVEEKKRLLNIQKKKQQDIWYKQVSAFIIFEYKNIDYLNSASRKEGNRC